MVTIEKSCEVLSNVDRVWELVSNIDKDSSYWSAIRDVKVLSKEGNRIEREATVGPRAFSQKSKQVIELDPKRSVRLTLTGESMEGERSILLVPTGKDSTRVDVSWRLEIKDLPGFVQGIVKGQIGKATEEALLKFKKEAESPRVLPAGGELGS